MTAKNGRDPEFRLQRNGKAVALQTWADEILENVMGIAECLDRQEDCSGYTDAVRLMQGLVADADETPSARVLSKLRDDGLSFFELALSLAEGQRDYFDQIAPLSEDRQQQFATEAEESIFKQQQIEASDSISLDEYLATYFSSGT